jgi:CheY-like chemotaxis protein
MSNAAFRVLVVDDDPDMLAFLAQLVTVEGMRAGAVADGEALDVYSVRL